MADGARVMKQRRFRHARRRLHERFDIDLTRETQAQIVSAIRAGESERARFLDRQSNNRTMWLVTHEGREIPVVYDKARKQIVTALRREWIESEENADG